MKLRNKKTGEIKEVEPITIGGFRSIAELNKEWEDYEEPKEYWFIDYDGGIVPFNRNKETATGNLMKQIGNYFETEEEAEKAVEKLKAWKRLKDKGFRFGGWETDSDGDLDCVLCNRKDRMLFNNAETLAMAKDLNLLFGGEE